MSCGLTKEQGDSAKIVSVAIFKNSDWHWELGMPVRLKRKYGKFDRKGSIYVDRK